MDGDPELELPARSGGMDRDASEHVRDARIISKSIRKTFSKHSMLALLSLYGKPRLTLDQYTYMGAVLRETGSDIVLPSHSTVRQRLLPYLIKELFVKSMLRDLEVTKECSVVKGKKPVVLISPVAWAVMDLACAYIAKEMFCNEHSCTCNRDTMEVLE